MSSASTTRSSEFTSNNILGGLPCEVWQLILSYLPVQDLCHCAVVSRAWSALVNSVDKTAWKFHFLRSQEWKHPAWPCNEESYTVLSWQTLYKEHHLSSLLWSTPSRHQVNEHDFCFHVFNVSKKKRELHVGPSREFSSLKSALAAAHSYDKIILYPGTYDTVRSLNLKIPIEIKGNGSAEKIVLCTNLESIAATAKLCNLTLRYARTRHQVVKHGHLQVDNCIIDQCIISVRSPATVHIRYCSFVQTLLELHHVNCSLIENCDFISDLKVAIYSEGLPSSHQNWIHPYLVKQCDTYKLYSNAFAKEKDKSFETGFKKDTYSESCSAENNGLKCRTTAIGDSYSISDKESITSYCLDNLESLNENNTTDTTSSSDSSSGGSESNYSDDFLNNSQPWIGLARGSWGIDEREPPIQWDTDPIPAISQSLHHDAKLRSAMMAVKGCLLRRCLLHVVNPSVLQGGIVVERQAHFRMENCKLTGLQYGVKCMQSSLVSLIENTICHCSSSALFFKTGASGTVLGNDIFCTGEAGLDIRKEAYPLVKHNRIHHSKRSGIAVLWNGQGIIQGNDIYQNREAGIYILYKGNPYISGNRICHGGSSGIAVSEGGKGYIIDNMITGNLWGGIDVRRGSNPHITRNLLCNGLADGIVICSNGFGSIVANSIRGNMGCGIWVMSGKPYIHANQIFNNKESGIVFITKERSDSSIDDRGVSDSESDFETDAISSSESVLTNRRSQMESSTQYSKLINNNHHVTYNSIYHNAAHGILLDLAKDSVQLFGNAIHGNNNTGLVIKQAISVNIDGCSITCNNGDGLYTEHANGVNVTNCGIYDNNGSGVIAVSSNLTVISTDIICNKLSVLCAETKATIQIADSRLFAPYDVIVKASQLTHIDLKKCSVYKGLSETHYDVDENGSCTADTSSILSSARLHTEGVKGYYWPLKDPQTRPDIPEPPRIEIKTMSCHTLSMDGLVTSTRNQHSSITCNIL